MIQETLLPRLACAPLYSPRPRHTYGTTIVSADACLALSPLRSYRFVVLGELCPASSEATDKSTP